MRVEIKIELENGTTLVETTSPPFTMGSDDTLTADWAVSFMDRDNQEVCRYKVTFCAVPMENGRDSSK